MEESTTLINILCYKLPQEVSQPLFREFNDRWTEIERIWSIEDNRYSNLQRHKKTIKALLAMSTYYRRVIGGLVGATDFYKMVSYNGTDYIDRPVKMGNFLLDREKNNQLLMIKYRFSKLQKKYNIPDIFFEYDATIEFLINCQFLLMMGDNTPKDDNTI